MNPVALTIAGSDPSGGAGLQADLKTFHQHGVYGTTVATLVTVQNTRGVSRVEVLAAELVKQQLEAVLSDLPPAAAKSGALGDAAVIEEVANQASQFDFPLVVDPVMISKHGSSLIDQRAVAALRQQLLPRAFLVTPNRHEAEQLSGIAIHDLADMGRAAAAIATLGPEHVLIKGEARNGQVVDLLWTAGIQHRFAGTALATQNTHGSGCVFSAAITANLAQGKPLLEAIGAAKEFITRAIDTNPGLGGGRGPVNMHAAISDP